MAEQTRCPKCDEAIGFHRSGPRKLCDWHAGFAAGYEDGRWHGFEVGKKLGALQDRQRNA